MKIITIKNNKETKLNNLKKFELKSDEAKSVKGGIIVDDWIDV